MLIRRALTFFLTAALLFSPSRLVSAEDKKPAPATVTPIAVSVMKPVKSADGEDLLFGPSGTQVTLLVKGVGKQVIDVDSDLTKLFSFSDSLGNKLVKPNDQGFQLWQPANDGSMGTINLNGSELPAKGATGVVVKAELGLVVGSKTKTQDAKNVLLKTGKRFIIGGIPCKIVKADKPFFGDNELEVNLQFVQDISQIAEIQFLDNAGNVLESTRTMTSTSQFGDQYQASVGFELKKKADAATIRFKLWTDMEKVKVPVDLSFGLGL